MLIYFTYLIELVVPGVATTGNQSTTFSFQDYPFLRAKAITSIEVFTVNDIAVSPLGNALIDTATLKKAYLTVYSNKPNDDKEYGQWMLQLPLVTMHTLQNSAVDPFEREPLNMKGRIITWEKTKIELGSPIENETPVSFLLNVTYLDVVGQDN